MANGSFKGGTGTSTDPYLIEDAHDLNAVRNDLLAHYKLVKDIDLNIPPYNTGTGWTPIGITDNPFKGTFNGDGFTIRGLYINLPTTSSPAGLFGIILNSVVEKIIIVDANITSGTANSGILIGRTESNSIVRYCATSGNFKANGLNSAGISGYAINNSRISNCYSTASITSSGTYRSAGICAYNNGSIVENCYFAGKITGTSSRFGIVGNGVEAVNSFWDTDVAGFTTSLGGVGKNTTSMKSTQTFIDAGWNLILNSENEEVWSLRDNEYPRLLIEKSLILNKTLILHDNEYKKIGSNIEITKDFVQTEQGSLLKYVNSKGDVLEASSAYEGYYPNNLFNNIISNSLSWTTSSASVNKGSLKFTMSEKMALKEYSFWGNTMNEASLKRNPKNWTLKASNDNLSWNTLDSQANYNFSDSNEKKFKVGNSNPYKYYLFEIESSGDLLQINEMNLIFEKLSFEVVSSTLPTQEQFITKGMDSLSPLLDRRIETLEPLPMTEDSAQIESGKLFSKTLNLNKYIDIRTIKVDVK